MLVALSWLLVGPDPLVRAFSPSARAVIAHPDRVTIYAVEPSRSVGKPNLKFKDAIAARRLSPTQARQATAALFACLRVPSGATMMSCFDPHHGLEFERGKRWVKVWICFTCHGTRVQESGGREAMVGAGLAGRATLDRLVPKVESKAFSRRASP